VTGRVASTRPPPRRARLDPKTRRAQLVDTARQLLEQRGVGTMSIEDVADAAGVSRSLVYAYFGDRDGLVAEVYLRVLDQLEERLRPYGVADLPRDQQTMAEVIEGCMRFAHEHPGAWRLLVTDSVRRHPTIVETRAQRVDALTKAHVCGSASGSNDGSDDGACDPLVGDAILGLLEAGVLHWVERSDLPARRAARTLAAILWTGLRDLSV
jgi:AcrR family transcriptional regulator